MDQIDDALHQLSETFNRADGRPMDDMKVREPTARVVVGRRTVTLSYPAGSWSGEGSVPLSEDEQRRLDEIERALYRDDPTFAAGQSLERLRRRRMVAAGAVVLIGMVLLVVGLVVTNAALVVGVIISVTGFLSMVGGAAVIIRRRRS
jgi:hypothetical protein